MAELAAAAGLEPRYAGADGVVRDVSPDTLKTVLERLGWPCASPSQRAESLAELDSAHAAAPRSTAARAPSVLERAGRSKAWGAAAQIYALPGGQAPGFGDYGTLAACARALGATGAHALAISPTHALFPDAPARCSPYAPSSRLWRNTFYADPCMVDGLHTPPEGPPAGAELIDWPNAGPAQLRRLDAAYDTFVLEGPEPLRAAFAAFQQAGGPALARHCAFEAQRRRLEGDGARRQAFHQWLAAEGLARAQTAAREAGMPIGLIADLAVGVAPDGADVWVDPQAFLTGLTIGAPPDPLGPLGQNWGLTTYTPQALRQNDCAALRAMLRSALAFAGGVRVDHILGLRRLWVIPEGATAVQGVYLRYPFEALLAAAAEEAATAGAILIGEDLGTVPDGLRASLAASGVLGLRVLLFERDGEAFTDSAGWDADAVAMTTTHDTPTLAGWRLARDIEWRARLEEISATSAAELRAARARDVTALGRALPVADDPVDAALMFIAQSACALALAPLEDLLGLEEQPNLPGTVDSHPNWRRRLPAEALDRPELQRRLAEMRAARP